METSDPFRLLEAEWQHARSAASISRTFATAKIAEQSRRAYSARWPKTCRKAAHSIPGGTVSVNPAHLGSAERLIGALFPNGSDEAPAARAFLDVLAAFERGMGQESAEKELLAIATQRSLAPGLVFDIENYLRHGEPVKGEHPTQFRALFVLTGDSYPVGSGLVGTVTIEFCQASHALRAPAKLYPTPKQSCVYRDADCREAEKNVIAWLNTLGVLPLDADLRWSLAIAGSEVPIRAVTGDSAGLIFALGAAQCLVRAGRLAAPHILAQYLGKVSLGEVASLAALDGPAGVLGKVGGEWCKLSAAAKFFPRLTQVVAAEPMRGELQAQYPGLRESPPVIDNAIQVHFSSSIEAAAKALWEGSADEHGMILDYTPSRLRHRRYYRRKVIEDDLNACIEDAKDAAQGLYWLLVADGFFGKSAFANHWFPKESAGVAGHFFKELPATGAAVLSLASQLRRLHPEIPKSEPPPRANLQSILYEALKIAGKQARRRGSVQVVVIDGLDEALVGDERTLAAILPRPLPPGVVVALTARNDKCLDWLDRPNPEDGVSRLNLKPMGRATHPEEIAEFLQRRNAATGLDLEEPLLGRLAAACEHLFGLACWFLDDERAEFRADIERWRREPDTIPSGPVEWALDQWERLIKRGRELRLPEPAVRGVMTLLSLARAPLSADELHSLLDGAAAVEEKLDRAPLAAFRISDLAEGVLQRILEAALPFFDPTSRELPSGETPLRFFHTMLPELILRRGAPLKKQPTHVLPSPPEKKWCRSLLAAGCGQAWSGQENAARLHALRHLPFYLRDAGKWDELLELLTADHAGFPLAKLCEEDAEGTPFLTFDLVQDYLDAVLHWPGNLELEDRRRFEKYQEERQIYWSAGGAHESDPERRALPEFPAFSPPPSDPRFRRLQGWAQTFSSVAPYLALRTCNPLAPLLNHSADGPVRAWAEYHLNLHAE